MASSFNAALVAPYLSSADSEGKKMYMYKWNSIDSVTAVQVYKLIGLLKYTLCFKKVYPYDFHDNNVK